MKEFLKAAFEKWFVGIVTAAALFLGSALWDYFNRFYTMPDRMDAWERRATIDSLFYQKVIHRNDSLDKLQTEYILYLEDVLQKNGIR